MWTAQPLADTADGVDEATGRRRLNVVCMSATVPTGFCVDTGLKTRTRAYPSPFADAYHRSAIYLPALAGDQLAAACRTGRNQRARFDLSRHAGFAADQLTQLTAAHPGGVLVLSATARDGRTYTDHLRAEWSGRRVWSQWDDRSLRTTVGLWKQDEPGVLVGTRSLMTGLDAPGPTCSLVILDRVPRAAPNPIDDARAEAITAGGVDPWVADMFTMDAFRMPAAAGPQWRRLVGDAPSASGMMRPQTLDGGLTVADPGVAP